MAFFSSAEIPCTTAPVEPAVRPQHAPAQHHQQQQQHRELQHQHQLQQGPSSSTSSSSSSSQMSVEQETEKLNAFLFNPFWKHAQHNQQRSPPTQTSSLPSSQTHHQQAQAPVQMPKPAAVPPKAPVNAAKMLAALANNPRERYALHKRLRHSIYGEVYMGTDRLTGQRVAVKVSVLELLREHTSRNGIGVLEDPVHEAELMRKISGHPHVVQLVATHEDKQLHWMVQEFIGGGELFELLVKHGHFNERVSHHFFLCLLAGLQHIHRSGVCHLDLSLENLLVDERGFVKICDFGLARLLPPEGKPFTGADDNKPGKVNYMAPEVFAGKDFWGCSADLFSCGVILFTMLTGHPPFENASKSDERYKLIAEGKIDRLLAALRMTNRVPVAAMDLLTRLMHPDPRHRLKTVEDVALHPWIKAGGNSQGSSSAAAASAGQRH